MLFAPTAPAVRARAQPVLDLAGEVVGCPSPAPRSASRSSRTTSCAVPPHSAASSSIGVSSSGPSPVSTRSVPMPVAAISRRLTSAPPSSVRRAGTRRPAPAARGRAAARSAAGSPSPSVESNSVVPSGDAPDGLVHQPLERRPVEVGGEDAVAVVVDQVVQRQVRGRQPPTTSDSPRIAAVELAQPARQPLGEAGHHERHHRHQQRSSRTPPPGTTAPARRSGRAARCGRSCSRSSPAPRAGSRSPTCGTCGIFLSIQISLMQPIVAST